MGENRIRVQESTLVDYVEEFLDSYKRLQSLIPKSRKIMLPEWLTMPYRIDIRIFDDGVIINFVRRTKNRRSKISVRTHKGSMKPKHPMIFRDTNWINVNAEGACLSDSVVVTKEVFQYYKFEGASIIIPSNFGLVTLSKTGDVRFENVDYYWIVDKELRHLRFNRFWIFGSNDSSLFATKKARSRAGAEFFPHLLSKNLEELLMKRDDEKKVKINLAPEVDRVKKEFTSLLTRDNLDEPEIQDFLEKHLFLLDPLYLDYLRKTLKIKSQDRLGKRIVDFLLVRSLDLQTTEKRISVIEIKKPNVSPFSSRGMSRYLRNAIYELTKAFEWLEKNPHVCKFPQNVRGVAIVGKDKDFKRYFNSEKASTKSKRIGTINKQIKSLMGRYKNQIKIVPFDALLSNIEFVKKHFLKETRYRVLVVDQRGSGDFTDLQEAHNHI